MYMYDYTMWILNFYGLSNNVVRVYSWMQIYIILVSESNYYNCIPCSKLILVICITLLTEIYLPKSKWSHTYHLLLNKKNKTKSHK